MRRQAVGARAVGTGHRRSSGALLEALAAQLDAEHRLFDDLKQTLAEHQPAAPPSPFSAQGYGWAEQSGRR